MFATDGFPMLEAIVWFNEAKEADWRLESSTAALDAFAAAVGGLGEGPATASLARGAAGRIAID
jgi:hypothetical protein